MAFRIISRGVKNIDLNNHQLRYLSPDTNNKMKMFIGVTLNTNQASKNQHWVDMKFELNAKNEGSDQAVYILSFTHSCLVETSDLNGVELQRMLMIDVPAYELPRIDAYTKEITKGTGYAPFSIIGLDFEQLYNSKTQNTNN